MKILERMDAGEATPMDLEVMESVQGNIIGHCLCLLGDSMAMPISSMIRRFRPEFEAHIEEMAKRRQQEEMLTHEPIARVTDEPLEGAAMIGLGVETHPQRARTGDEQPDGHGGSV